MSAAFRLTTCGLLLVLGLVACGGKASSPPKPSGEPTAERASTSGRIKIETAEGQPVATLFPSKKAFRIELADGTTVTGTRGADGRRAYALAAGASLGHAVTDKTRTTLSGEDGKPRFELVAAGRRVRVSRVGSNAPAWVLVRTPDDRIRVLVGEQELGRVTFDRAKLKARAREPGGKALFDIVTSRTSSAFGVLLLPDLTATERAMLMAEIHSRGL